MLVVFLQPFCSLSVLCNAQTYSHKHQKQHITRTAAVLLVFLQPFCCLSVLCTGYRNTFTQTTAHHQGLQLCWWSFYSLSAACLYCVSQKHIHTNTSKQHITKDYSCASGLFTAFLQLVCIVYWSQKHIRTNTSKQHITKDYSCAGGLITLCPVPPAATRQSVPQTAASYTPPKTAVCTVFSDLVQFCPQLAGLLGEREQLFLAVGQLVLQSLVALLQLIPQTFLTTLPALAHLHQLRLH